MIRKIMNEYYQNNSLNLDEILTNNKNLKKNEVLTYFEEIKNNQLILRNSYAIGKIDKKRQIAFLIQKENPNDLKLEFRDLKDAMDKDLVLVKKHRKYNKVELIIERNLSEIIATTKIRRGKLTIVTKDKFEQVVSCPNLGNLSEGLVVLLKVERITSDYITTSFSEVIGSVNDKNIDYLILAYENHWQTKFSDKVKEEAINLLNKPIDKTSRIDLTNILTFTIDGSDTKDIDDALSIVHIREDIYEVGIHIADVSHYVSNASEIDKTARIRANSLYFPNWVIPMLPEELSNDLCSLNPNTEKLALSLLIKIKTNGDVVDYKLVESIIKSDYQLTYDDVNDLITNNKNVINNEVSSLLIKLNEITQSLNQIRNKRGQINFLTRELKFSFDNNGRPIKVSVRESREAEQLIESLMILANEIVAKILIKKNYPVILRVHDKPDDIKLELAFNQLQLLGVNTNYPKDSISTKLQKITNNSYSNKLKYIINNQLLRSMQRAKYSDEIKGHFGLASEEYAHFTAPIRRYSDLYLHRLIKDLLFGNVSDKKIRKYREELPGVANHTSTQERIAIQIERDAISITSFYYLKDSIGKTFNAMLISINPHIMFAELENGIEIALPVRDLNFGVVYDEKRQVLKSRNKIYELGTDVVVILNSVNELDKQLNFTILEDHKIKVKKGGKKGVKNSNRK